jgi:hypothetical protein
MAEVTDSSVDCCASATKHSEGAYEHSGIVPGLYGTSPHAQNPFSTEQAFPHAWERSIPNWTFVIPLAGFHVIQPLQAL